MTTTNSYICSNCGQEFNPPNHVCTPKPVTNANSTVNTGLYSYDIKAEIVAARDKEWIKWFDDLTIGCDGGWGTDCAGKPIILDISPEQWQQLKQSMGVKE